MNISFKNLKVGEKFRLGENLYHKVDKNHMVLEDCLLEVEDVNVLTKSFRLGVGFNKLKTGEKFSFCGLIYTKVGHFTTSGQKPVNAIRSDMEFAFFERNQLVQVVEAKP